MKHLTHIGVAWLVLAAGCGDRSVDPATASDAGTDSSDPSEVHCFVDFPCWDDNQIVCVTATQYQKTQTFGCERYCGDDPCSGAACEAVGPVLDCPAGQICIRGDDWRGDRCGYQDDPAPDPLAPTCFVDFPCAETEQIRCVSQTEYQQTQTYGCEHYCGDEPCSGAACEAVGPVLSCPEGQVCISSTTEHGAPNNYCGVPGDPTPKDAGTTD